MKNKALSPDDVASFLNISKNNLYVRLHRGVFPQETFFRVGRRVYFNHEKFNNWINSGGGLA